MCVSAAVSDQSVAVPLLLAFEVAEMGNQASVNQEQIATAVGSAVAAALTAAQPHLHQPQQQQQQQHPQQYQQPPQAPQAQPFPPPPPPVVLAPQGPVPAPAGPPPGDFQEPPVQYLRTCRFCGEQAYWREGICLSEQCRAAWLHLIVFCFRFVCSSITGGRASSP